MVKIRRNFIKLCWLIILLQIGNSSQVFAEESTQPVRDMELLFVIDNSGSVRKEAASIMGTIDLLQDWLNKEPLISSVQYIAMADGSKYAEYGNFPALEQYTCIKSGVELADKWLSERLGNGKVKGIVFVTDLVESHKAVVGKSFDKSAEQKDISDILNHWEKDYSDEMDYMFITWKTDAGTSNWEFVCEIPESKLCNLKKGSEGGSEESISKIHMTGIIMQNIVEMQAGVELEGEYKTSALKRINLENTSMLYGFIILGKEAQWTVNEEQGDLPPLDVQAQSDSMQIYRLTEQDAGKVYQLKSDNEIVNYYLFYIPKEDLLFNINHGLIVRAGERFDISLSFQDNDYRRHMVKSPLYICFVNPETREETGTEIKLDEKDGEFTGCGTLQHAGTYNYEVRNEGKEVLEVGKIEVRESESVTLAPCDDDTLQPDEEPLAIKYIIFAVVILALLAGGAAVFIVYRKQKGAR